MIPGDRLICTFVTSMETGDTFKKWPLHVTIIPWFRIELTTEDLGRQLHGRLQKLEPFEVRISGEAKFGARRRLVSLIAEPTPLTQIEQATRQLLHEHKAWMVDETTKKRRPFRPHVTEQKSGRLHDGDRFVCDAVYIVEQKGDHKVISSKIEL